MGVGLPRTWNLGKTLSADGFSYRSSSAAALSNGSFLTFADGLIGDYAYDERLLGWGFTAGRQGISNGVVVSRYLLRS